MKKLLLLFPLFLCSCEEIEWEKHPIEIINGHSYVHIDLHSTVHDPECPKCREQHAKPNNVRDSEH